MIITSSNYHPVVMSTIIPSPLLGLKGRKGDLNQDNFFGVRYGDGEILLGVFDGHGPRGEVFSEMAALWAPLVTVRDPHYSLNKFSSSTTGAFCSGCHCLVSACPS